MEFTQLIAQRYSCKILVRKGKVDAAALHHSEAGRLAPPPRTLRNSASTSFSRKGLAKIDLPLLPLRCPHLSGGRLTENHTFTYPGRRMNSGMEDAAIVATHPAAGALPMQA